MFKSNINVITKVDLLKNISKTLNDLKKIDVLVGIPQKESSRPDDEKTNAELLYFHTHGSPLQKIPARPVLEPAIEYNKEEISRYLGEAIKNGLDGNIDNANNALNKAGLKAQKSAQEWFTNPANKWAPNSPLTIRLKGSDKPLIDTGELRKSITYVIRKK